MRLEMKSLKVFAFNPKTGAFRDPLPDASGKPFEIDDVSAIQSSQRGVAVSNGNLNSSTPGNNRSHACGPFGAITFGHSTLSDPILSSESLQEHPMVFEERFRRCRDSLYFIACRVLGSAKAATQAVENCFLKASRNPPRFESDGAFGSWMLRILIDETLLIRDHKKCSSTTFAGQGFSQAP